MKLMKPKELLSCARPGLSLCLSIYVNSPDEISSRLADAQKTAASNLGPYSAALLLQPAIEFSKSSQAKVHQGPMAIFVREGFSGYTLLPFPTRSLAIIANRFYMKPILKWQQRDRSFLLLHLDFKNARLYSGNLGALSLQERFDFKEVNSFDDISHAMHQSLWRNLLNTHQPLILAGQNIMTEKFRKCCDYLQLTNRSITKISPDPMVEELHQKSLQILEPGIVQSEDDHIKRYWNAKSQKLTSSNFSEVVRLALQGKIQHLFINEEMNVWGKINYLTGKIDIQSKQMGARNGDVLDDLAELVLYRQGQVTVLPGNRMPESHAVASILKNTNSSQNENNANTDADEAWPFAA